MRVLQEGQKLGYWSLHDVYAPKFKVPFSEDPDEKDIFLFGAWHPAYDALFDIIKNARPDAIKGVLWTSSAAEVGFELREHGYLRHIIESSDVDFIWFGDKDLVGLCDKAFHARYPLVYGPHDPAEKQDTITLFAPTTVKKNLFNQLLAIHYLQERRPDLHLRTNLDPDFIFSLPFTIRHRAMGWLPATKYADVLRHSQLNFAVSWAETFCYQVAEAAMLGTPSVLGCQLPWLSYDRDFFADPADVGNIVEKAEYVLDNREAVTQRLRDELFAWSRYNRYILDELDERYGATASDVDKVSTNKTEKPEKGARVR
jgi:glycosyltransferase involved in cell wall biosynthesis